MHFRAKASILLAAATTLVAACSSSPPNNDVEQSADDLAIRPGLPGPKLICGIDSFPCCNTIVFVNGIPKPGYSCNTGSVCTPSGICAPAVQPPCGQTGQACCTGGVTACTDPSTQCMGSGTGTCGHCGFPGEMACNTGERCAYGSELRIGVNGATCVSCGGLNQTCCRSLAPDKETAGCRAGECNAGVCQPCGGDGQACCYDGCMNLGGEHTCQSPNNTAPVCKLGSNPPDLSLTKGDNDCVEWAYTHLRGESSGPKVLLAFGKVGEPPLQTDHEVYTDHGVYTFAPQAKCLLAPQAFYGLGFQECKISMIPFDYTLHCPGWQSYVAKTPANLLADGDFENGSFGHTGSATIDVNTPYALSGKNRGAIRTGTALGWSELFETVRVKPHTNYHFTGYMTWNANPDNKEIPTSAPWGVRDATTGVKIREQDGMTDYRSYGDGYGTNGYGSSLNGVYGGGSFGDYARHQMDFNTGDASSVTVYVGFAANGTAQHLYVENLWLSEVIDR